MEKEIWKTIENYPDYQVSSLGRVKSLWYGKERILKQAKNKDNYCLVNLCKDGKRKMYLVHRLVGQTFLPNPNNYPQINHKNERKTDNRIGNLEWVTHKQNSNFGTRNERIGKALSIAQKGRVFSQEWKNKIAKANSKPILQFNREGTKIIGKWDSAVQASKELNINRGHICNCCNGKLKTCGGSKWIYIEDYVNRMEKLYNLALKKVG